MVEQVEEGILVVASSSSDRALIDELLRETAPSLDFPRPGSHVRTTSGFDTGPRSGPLALATIVCHRRSACLPRPRLPELDRRGRVVVISDCMEEETVVATLEAGAHHYLDLTESRTLLTARLAAALRSHSRLLRSELVVPPFRLDPRKRRVWSDGDLIGLSPKEFDLAFYLFSHRGRVVGNPELMTAVWSLPRSTDSRRIDTAACRVRKKMGLEGETGWQLRRLRGAGYQLFERSGRPVLPTVRSA